jgi:hypothetical protein
MGFEEKMKKDRDGEKGKKGVRHGKYRVIRP